MRRSQMRARTTLLATALTLAASGAGASVAAASAPPNPHWGGPGGACNMIFTPAEPHMTTNPVNNPGFPGANGLAGMFHAIQITTGLGPDCGTG
jgi:hypothetical protein